MRRVQAVYGGIATGDKWKIWNYAVGAVIAEEAGILLIMVDGRPFYVGRENIVCTTQHHTPEIVEELFNFLK